MARGGGKEMQEGGGSENTGEAQQRCDHRHESHSWINFSLPPSTNPKWHLRDFPAAEVRKWEVRKPGIHTLWPDSHCRTASRDQRSQLAGTSAFGIWRRVSPSGRRAVLWRGATAPESAWQGTPQGLREKRKDIPGIVAEPQHGPRNPGYSLQRLARKSGD